MMVDEMIPPGEEEFQGELLKLLRAKMLRENPDTMHRDAHPKQHGLVKAAFKVMEDIPAQYQFGVFQPGAHYDCWVRFSNANAPAANDNKKDIRGVGLKLMNVAGDKLDVGDGNETSQDFLLISTPVFISKGVKDFCKLVKALETGTLAVLWHVLWHPRSAWNIFQSNKCFTSPTKIRYWSATPYRLGEAVVKYSLVPSVVETCRASNSNPDFLRQALIDELSKGEVGFDFCIQTRTDPDDMPVENTLVRWSEKQSPFVKVAELRIPKQAFDSDAQNSFGRDLSFNPWHSLAVHEPLGGINRARRVVYNALSEFRHSKNAVPREEPTSFVIPETLD